MKVVRPVDLDGFGHRLRQVWRRLTGVVVVLGAALAIVWLPLAGASSEAGLLVGAAVDVAPWGRRISAENGRAVGIEWAEPRDVQRVVVTFAAAPPDASAARLQWWQSGWPERRSVREAAASSVGNTRSGRRNESDQGTWRDADVYLQPAGRAWTFTFRHLNLTEFPKLSDVTAEHRTTSRIRVLFAGPAPAIERIEAHTDAEWRTRLMRLPWHAVDAGQRPKLSVFNGFITASVPSESSDDTVALWFTQSSSANSSDATSVTVETARRVFSFEPAARPPSGAGRMLFLTDAEEAGRRFAVNADGTVSRDKGRTDDARGRGIGRRFDFDFGMPVGEPVRRWVEDDCLPIMNTEWEHDGIRYTQTALVARFGVGDPGFRTSPVDATFVLIVRILGKNTAQEYRLAHATLSVSVDDQPLPVVLRDGLLFADQSGISPQSDSLAMGALGGQGKGESLLAAVEVQGAAQGTQENGKVHLAGNMPPGTDGFMVVRIPMVPPEHPDDLERLRNLEFDAEFRRAKRFWQEPAGRQ